MHELGIAKDLFKQLSAAAQAHGLARVERIVIKLGVLTGIEPHHLAEHLAEEAAGSPLAETRYEFLDLSPGDALSAEEAGRPAAQGGAIQATGFEIIIAKMEGR